MTKADNYLYDAIRNILDCGILDENPRPKYEDGTPAHTKFINHVVRTYDISNGEFPITTLRPIAWKTAIKEIMWIYQDASNNLDLLHNKYNVHYWDEWESKDLPGSIGARYGETVRTYDLMRKLLKDIKEDPYGRRHIIDLWQYEQLMATDGLAPCAFLTIWNVRGKYLDLSLIQRSGDTLAASCSGVNEIQYTALLMMVARDCGYEPGVLTHYVANEQLYTRHFNQCKELMKRYEEMSHSDKKPHLILNPNKNNFYDFTIDDFTMVDYDPIQPQITFPLGI